MATPHKKRRISPPQEPVPTTLPHLQPDLDTTLFTIYCFIKNFVGAGSNTSDIIEARIEQAMDFIKNHLMYTVREEVEVLKERTTVLLDRIHELKIENNSLKAIATPEVLTALNNRASGAQAQGINPSATGADAAAPTN